MPPACTSRSSSPIVMVAVPSMVNSDFYVGMLVQRRALPGFGRDDVGREGHNLLLSPTELMHIPAFLIEEFQDKITEIFSSTSLHRIDERGATRRQKAGH